MQATLKARHFVCASKALIDLCKIKQSIKEKTSL